MQITDCKASTILKMVNEVVCKSSCRPKTECEEVADAITSRIIGRLLKVSKLRKPLSHYVRHTAAREALREFAKLDRRKQKEQDFARSRKEEHQEIDPLEEEEIQANLVEALDRLPREERDAVLQYYGYEGYETRPRNYYLRNKALRFLRAFFEGRNLT